MSLIETEVPTPIGPLFLVERDGALCAVGFAAQRKSLLARVRARFPGEPIVTGEARAAKAIAAYLDGDLRALDALAVDPGGTPFQKRVWAALRRIPAGRTASYGDIARQLGSPAAVRAVGAANGRNPISLVIPCHRVIRSDGALCGYAGGLDKKRWLLAHEGIEVR
jgi:methylated-DNA-[protein]-cysteine S-methyltransferase